MPDPQLVALWGLETVETLEQIAGQIFARHGVEFAAAQRAGGWSNAVWLAGGLALRLSTQPGDDRLAREAALAELLPPEVGYPPVLESGVTGGYAWTQARMVPGQNLAEAWPALPAAAQAAALAELWQRARAIHQVDAARAAGLVRTRGWFNSDDLREANALLDGLAAQLTSAQRQALRGILERHAHALNGAAAVVNHGDLTRENCIWSDGLLAALLDFEWAVLAPPELDWYGLCRWAFSVPEPGEDPGARAAMQRAVLPLARQELSGPGSFARLLGYAVLLELHQFGSWLAHPEGEGPLENWAPRRRLIALAGGGGDLAALRFPTGA